jgi:hypothetical protein
LMILLTAEAQRAQRKKERKKERNKEDELINK